VQDEDYKGMRFFIDQYPEDYNNIIPILTDNNSNYICVVTNEDGLGTIDYLSHDEEGLIRVFKNIPTMVEMINNHKEYWDIAEFPKSYYS